MLSKVVKRKALIQHITDFQVPWDLGQLESKSLLELVFEAAPHLPCHSYFVSGLFPIGLNGGTGVYMMTACSGEPRRSIVLVGSLMEVVGSPWNPCKTVIPPLRKEHKLFSKKHTFTPYSSIITRGKWHK